MSNVSAVRPLTTIRRDGVNWQSLVLQTLQRQDSMARMLMFRQDKHGIAYEMRQKFCKLYHMYRSIKEERAVLLNNTVVVFGVIIGNNLFVLYRPSVEEKGDKRERTLLLVKVVNVRW